MFTNFYVNNNFNCFNQSQWNYGFQNFNFEIPFFFNFGYNSFLPNFNFYTQNFSNFLTNTIFPINNYPMTFGNNFPSLNYNLNFSSYNSIFSNSFTPNQDSISVSSMQNQKSNSDTYTQSQSSNPVSATQSRNTDTNTLIPEIETTTNNSSDTSIKTERITTPSNTNQISTKTEVHITTKYTGTLSDYNETKGKLLGDLAEDYCSRYLDQSTNTIGASGKSPIWSHSDNAVDPICAAYVKTVIQDANLGEYEPGHAFQMIDILKDNPNFKRINPAEISVKDLPAGCVIVYGKGVGGYSEEYGHTEITLGNGTCASQAITMHPESRGTPTAIYIPV